MVREQTTKADSLIPTFGRLAGRILNVAPGGAGNAGSLGTTSIDAYHAYIAGVQALNRFDVAEAKKRLEGALALDSTFALAHYKLALASFYDEAAALERVKAAPMTFAGMISSRNDPLRLEHATAAARLSAPLPARERGLIAGLLAHIKGDFGRACTTYGALVAADSSDVEALYGLGHCLYRDDLVAAGGIVR